MSAKRFALVTGATGQQGGAVAQALLKRGHRVRALVRDPNSKGAVGLKAQGAEIAVANFEDRDALVQAAAGADSVYMMTTPFEGGIDAEIRQGFTLADAFSQANVGHLVFGSVGSADRDTGIPHFDSKYDVEKHIATLNIPYTISAPVYFMDNHLYPHALEALREGKLADALPADRLLQKISVSNIGEFVAVLIERRESVFGQRYEIAGDELSGEQCAAALSQATGKNIRYEAFSPDTFRPDNEDMALMYEWFARDRYVADIKALRRDFPEVRWLRFDEWARQRDWSSQS